MVFWQGAFTDLKALQLENIHMTVIGNLNGITRSIKNTFATADTKRCLVQQTLNLACYVIRKDKFLYLALIYIMH